MMCVLPPAGPPAQRLSVAWPLPGDPVLVAGCGLALAVVAVVGFTAGRRTRRAGHPPDRSPAGTPGERLAELVLTVAAAGIATAVAVNGMWNVFGDALGFTGIGRAGLAGFLEIALMVSALRARRSLRDHATVGVDGAAVWALAGLSAILAAADAHGLARVVRFAAPLVAAWLWERGLAAERRRTRARTPVVIAWRWTRERLAVRLGLAEPVHRATGDVDRARRLARLTRARLRLAVLEATDLPRPLAALTLQPLRRALAVWRLQRQALAAVEHLALGSDPNIPATIRTTVAAVVGLRTATAPAALTAASPWQTDDDTWAIEPEAITATSTPPAVPGSGHPIEPAPIEPDRIPSVSIESDRIDLDRIESPGRDGEAPAGAPAAVVLAAAASGGSPTASAPIEARPADVDRLRQAIAGGTLPERPSTEAIRKSLRISPAYARAARSVVVDGPVSR